MSTAYSSAKQQYIGNGVTTEWGFDFPIKKHSELKVYLKRSASPQVLLEEGVDYSFVTDNTITFPIKTGEAKLQASDVLALQRESVFESEYNFSNQQRLEPEEVMHADDNLERQIQELKRDVTQAIRIQPTSNIDTDEYFVAVESIYENLDNITNVSGISAEIVNCSDNISDISTVSSDIANVNTVGQSISDVNTVASNVSSVNTVAGVSTDVTTVAGISTDVSTVANNGANVTTVATNISDVNTAASNMAAIQAAPTAATNAANSATDSANSANASATSAQAAQDAADKVQGLLAIPIGTIFQSVYVDESLDIARKLNGQLISSTKFTGFRSWLNTVQTAAPNLFTTETNWQAEKTNSKLGQCGKFVVDDTAGTIRLPCVVNAQGLVDLALIGGIKSESLPNITGSATSWNDSDSDRTDFGAIAGKTTGAFTRRAGKRTKTVDSGNMPAADNKASNTMLGFDASSSSSTYQDNAPVQQEAVQYPYYIQVATGVEETLPAIREYKTNVPYVLCDSKYFEANPYNASWLESNGQYNSATVYPDLWSQLQVELNSSLNVGDTIEISGKTYIKRGLPVVLSSAAYTDYDFVVNQNDQTFKLPLLNGDRVLVAKKEATTEDPTWYNLYSDGWLEQGGVLETSQATTVTFVKPYITTPNVMATAKSLSTASVAASVMTTAITLASFSVISGGWNNDGIFTSAGGSVPKVWSAQGYTNIPQNTTWKLYYYVGDTVQDASLINAGAVLGQLSNKISRTAASDKETVVGWGIPDYTAGISISNNTNYVAPKSGVAMCVVNLGDFEGLGDTTIYINNNEVFYIPGTSAGSVRNLIYIPVSKGDIIKIYMKRTTTSSLKFYPFKGVN